MKKNIKISLLEPNTGQIPGLPENPRYIKDENFQKLVNSIIADPEMLEHRGQMVYPFNKKYVIIGGNMRLQAIQEVIRIPEDEFNRIVEEKRDHPDFLSWFAAIMLLRDKKEVPCEILDPQTSPDKLRAFAVKDNVAFGSWDHELLANEWDAQELLEWGLEVPDIPDVEVEEEEGASDVITSAKLVVESDTPEILEELHMELQARGFKCELSK